MHTFEPLERDVVLIKLKQLLENWKVYLSYLDRIQVGGKWLHSKIHKLVPSIWNKEELL